MLLVVCAGALNYTTTMDYRLQRRKYVRTGAHNDNHEEKGKGKEREARTQMIKFFPQESRYYF